MIDFCDEAHPYPLDFSTLEKGDVVSIKDVEAIYGVKFSTKEYNFACMDLIDLIWRETSRTGRPMRARVVKGAVQVMTDAEAAEYYDQSHDRHKSALRRNHVKTMSCVDAGMLNENQRRAFEESVVRNGRELIALEKEEKRRRLTTDTRAQVLLEAATERATNERATKERD